MKYFITFILLASKLIAQGTYTQGKIDMHGGSQENYRSNFGSYKLGGFRNSPADMSKFLDKNSTKSTLKQPKMLKKEP